MSTNNICLYKENDSNKKKQCRINSLMKSSADLCALVTFYVGEYFTKSFPSNFEKP